MTMRYWFTKKKNTILMGLFTLFLGLLSALALPNWSIVPFFFIGFSAFYALLSQKKSFRYGFGLGWLFAFGYYLLGLHWIGNALLVEGNKFAWAWPLAVCALPATLALYNALACGLVCQYFDLKKLSGFFAFISLYSISEYARGHLFTGFPWNLSGMIWSDTLPVLQLLKFGDIYLLSIITCFWASSIGFFFIQRTSVGALPALTSTVTLILVFLLNLSVYTPPSERAHDASDITVHIVQPNIQQSEKWDRIKMREHFERLLQMSAPQGNETDLTLIIWPETATSYGFLNNDAALDMISAVLNMYESKVYLVTGALLQTPDGSGITNSLVTIDKNGGIIQRYDKSHLVPFGEYIPFYKWIPLETVTRFSGFQSGVGPTTLQLPEGLSFSPLICYEIIFPGRIIPQGANPDVIINVTNDGWYGLSAGPYQHFAITKMRAIEEQTPVIRVANTGISGLISSSGRIIDKSVLGQESVVTTYFSKSPKVTHSTNVPKGWITFIIMILLTLYTISIRCNFRRKGHNSC